MITLVSISFTFSITLKVSFINHLSAYECSSIYPIDKLTAAIPQNGAIIDISEKYYISKKDFMKVSLEELKQQLNIFNGKETLTYGEITKKVNHKDKSTLYMMEISEEERPQLKM